MSFSLKLEGEVVNFQTGRSEAPEDRIDINVLAEALRGIDEGVTIHNLAEDEFYQSLNTQEQEAVRAYFSSMYILVKAELAGASSEWIQKLAEDLHLINLYARYS